MTEQSGRTSESDSAALALIIDLALSDANFRGRLIYFPDEVSAEFGLGPDTAAALSIGSVGSLDIAESLRIRAARVFDLHDLYAGE